MITESSIDSESVPTRTFRSFISSFSDCWECMAEYFTRAWYCFSDYCSLCWDWIKENIYGSCFYVGQRNQDVGRNHPNSSAIQHQTPGSSRPPKTGLPTITMSPNPSLDKAAKTISTSSLPPASPPMIQSSTAAASSPKPSQPIYSNQTSPSSAYTQHSFTSSATQRSSIQTSQIYNQPESPTPEPPKIDFVETGSIFGDRKKTGLDPNLLQLENGRFRSPGQSKTIAGPGGRTIRVSFLSGFPSLKSVDSHRSLASQTRKSSESASNGATMGASPFGKSLPFKSSKSLGSVGSSDSKNETDSINNNK